MKDQDEDRELCRISSAQFLPDERSNMVKYSFPGKVVLVTGGSRGMGATILEYFAAAGATCVVNYYPDAAGENQPRRRGNRRAAPAAPGTCTPAPSRRGRNTNRSRS